MVLSLDVLLLIRKRAPPPLPKMADVSAEEKVSLKDFLTWPFQLTALVMSCGRITVACLLAEANAAS